MQPIDPANLPTPSPDDIVKTLIKQKNIFPLIDALLRLVSSRSAPAPPQPELTAFQRPSTKGPLPASKKRKLSSVPAGATDWDVPYPFATGQGPSDYRTNWERERGKQLIDDLITLVKTAATKAATKNYYKEKHLPRKAGNGLSHYSEQVLRTAGLHLQKSSSTCSTPGPSIAGSGSTSPSPAPSDFSSFDWTSGQNQYDPFGGSQAMGSSSSCMPYPSPSGSSTPLSSIANWTEGSSPELDDFLALLDGLPQGDLADMFDMPGLDEGEGSQVLGDVQDEQKDKEKEKGKEEGSVGEGEGVVLDPTIFETDPSLLAIDPTLLAFSFPPPPPPPSTPNNEASGVGSSVQSQAKGGTGCVTASTTGFTNTTMKTTRTTKTMTNSTTSSRSGSGTPLTPTLVASPLSLVFDQEHEREPLTPVGSVWDFSGGGEEPEIVCGGNGNGMDVDGSDFDEGKCIKSQKGRGGRGRSTGASVLAGMDLRKKVLTRRAWLAVSGLEGCAGEETGYGRKDKGKKRARDDEDYFDDNEDSGITPEVNERRQIGMRGEEVQGRVFPRPTGSMPPLFVASTTPATPAPAYTHSGYTYPHPHPYTHPSVSFHPTPSFPTPTPTLTPSPSSTSTSTSPSNSNPTPSLRKPDKLSIIQRAREVRGKLEEEIRKARVELWECAMEGGCLVLVGKDKGGGVKSKGFGR